MQLWLAFAALAPLGFLFLFLHLVVHLPRSCRPRKPLPAVEVGNPAPVVMVVLDELPLASLLDGDGGIDASCSRTSRRWPTTPTGSATRRR